MDCKDKPAIFPTKRAGFSTNQQKVDLSFMYKNSPPLIHNNGSKASSLCTYSYLKSLNVLLKQKATSHRLWKV